MGVYGRKSFAPFEILRCGVQCLAAECPTVQYCSTYTTATTQGEMRRQRAEAAERRKEEGEAR